MVASQAHVYRGCGMTSYVTCRVTYTTARSHTPNDPTFVAGFQSWIYSRCGRFQAQRRPEIIIMAIPLRACARRGKFLLQRGGALMRRLHLPLMHACSACYACCDHRARAGRRRRGAVYKSGEAPVISMYVCTYDGERECLRNTSSLLLSYWLSLC